MEISEVRDGIHMIDTRQMGHEAHTAVFVVEADRTAVVETGLSTSRDRVLDGLDALGVARSDVDVILPTHVHLDHAGGAGFLADACPNATLVVPEPGLPFLTDADMAEKLVASVHRAVGGMAEDYGTVRTVDDGRARGIAPGDTVDLGSRALDVVAAPGHAPHQVALHDDATDALFVADEAGMQLHGRLHVTSPPPDFDADAILASLERFSDRDPDALIYTHYGVREDVAAALEEYRRLLTDWVDAIARAADECDDREAVIERFVDPDHHYFAIWGETAARETLRMDVEGVLRYLGAFEEA